MVLLAAIFLRGNVRDFVVLGILTAVVVYNLFVFFRPKWMLAMQQDKERREALRIMKPQKAPTQPPVVAQPRQNPPAPVANPAVASPVAQAVQQPSGVQDSYRDTLIRHVNYRITEKLKGVFPEVSWSWCHKDPAALAQTGGTARIRTFNAGGHEFADVEFSPNGNFRICLVMVTELGGAKKPAPKAAAEATEETDPDGINLFDWYEISASAVIRATIDEVNARGHQILYIDASGDVFTKEGENNVRQGKIGFMPSVKLWGDLVPLFAEDDVVAAIDGDVLALTWGN